MVLDLNIPKFDGFAVCRRVREQADTPIILGSEGAGVVTHVGADVSEVAAGDRVAFAMYRGSYAEEIVVPAAERALSLVAR